MNKLAQSSVGIVAALVALSLALPAGAATSLHNFVSAATGSDNNPCTRTLPCRSVGQAQANLGAGGEVTILDPGDYGNITGMSNSFSITNDGSGEARLAISFWTPPAGAVINLRGLTIDPVDPLFFGGNTNFAPIFQGSSFEVNIANCVIRNSQGNDQFGLSFEPSGNARLFITDTLITNNGSTSNNSGGILIQPTGSGSAKVVLDRVRIEDNVVGMKIDGSQASGGTGIHVEVRDSVVAHNFGDGILATRPATGGTPTVVLVEHSASVNNAGAGVRADTAAIVEISDSTMQFNGSGASVTNGGRLFSYGNNVVDNNTGEDLSPAALVRTTK